MCLCSCATFAWVVGGHRRWGPICTSISWTTSPLWWSDIFVLSAVSARIFIYMALAFKLVPVTQLCYKLLILIADIWLIDFLLVCCVLYHLQWICKFCVYSSILISCQACIICCRKHGFNNCFNTDCVNEHFVHIKHFYFHLFCTVCIFVLMFFTIKLFCTGCVFPWKKRP